MSNQGLLLDEFQPGAKVIWRCNYRRRGKIGGWAEERFPATIIRSRLVMSLIEYELGDATGPGSTQRRWVRKSHLEVIDEQF